MGRCGYGMTVPSRLRTKGFAVAAAQAARLLELIAPVTLSVIEPDPRLALDSHFRAARMARILPARRDSGAGAPLWST